MGFKGRCLYRSTENCTDTQPSCFSADLEFNATGPLTLHIRGCVDLDLCGKTVSGSILGAGYTSSFQCCTTNLCNGAASVQLSVTVALCAAVLSSLWGLW
ncbi:Sperm acrosome membrane-associated protein 4 [Dissostichus eleginoides]|uniref:Sperm acrosome membrane-associated protein 4 n=1 Tax=Dissostichus eleginoides TaxID=100907 RepID=A0AAD9EWA8_DISEL|nr:Sperm acrosome membrane-associated protein 4 [Dissostichus eleginoides]